MVSVNYAVIGGNLTRDPEMSYTPAGIAVVNFNVAVNKKWSTAGGEKKESVSFIECTAWKRTAELVAEYCKKGHPVLVEGELTQESWEQEGKKRSKTKITASKVHFLSKRAEDAEPLVVPEAAPDKDGGF